MEFTKCEGTGGILAFLELKRHLIVLHGIFYTNALTFLISARTLKNVSRCYKLKCYLRWGST